MQGRCRGDIARRAVGGGDIGEMQGRCRGDIARRAVGGGGDERGVVGR